MADPVEEAADPETATRAYTFWRRLPHRWFIEYNPLYLLSAALVLGGVNLISRSLAQQGASYLELGLTAITELYGWALIAGAALLTRLGFRRPAVMLALLTALYQCDLTLHTETCAYLGGVGLLASVVWFVSFVGKLFALAWALQIRLSASAVAVPTFAALGLTTLPYYLSQFDAASMTIVVALWLFAVFALGLWSSRQVKSLLELGTWGQTVLQRTLKVTWILWSVLTFGHVLFWSSEYNLNITVVLPVMLLLCTRWLRSEVATWCTVLTTLLLIAFEIPKFFSVTALMSAIVLCLHALRKPSDASANHSPRSAEPYRTPAADAAPVVPSLSQVRFIPCDRAAMMRRFTGAICCGYLSLWTLGWSGGVWPKHIMLLDLILTAAAVVLVWKVHTRIVLVPLATTYFHFGVQMQFISAPQSILQWGMLSVGVGFGLLAVSLLTSWYLRKLSREHSGCATGDYD